MIRRVSCFRGISFPKEVGICWRNRRISLGFPQLLALTHQPGLFSGFIWLFSHGKPKAPLVMRPLHENPWHPFSELGRWDSGFLMAGDVTPSFGYLSFEKMVPPCRLSLSVYFSDFACLTPLGMETMQSIKCYCSAFFVRILANTTIRITFCLSSLSVKYVHSSECLHFIFYSLNPVFKTIGCDWPWSFNFLAKLTN